MEEFVSDIVECLGAPDMEYTEQWNGLLLDEQRKLKRAVRTHVKDMITARLKKI